MRSAISPYIPAPRGKALLKGNKIISPFSDEADLVLRVVRDLVPTDAELGNRMLRPADLRALLESSTGAREDDEERELLVGAEAMVRARLDEDRMSFLHRNAHAFDLEHSRAFEHEIHLVVLVGLLPVRLRGDEHVDAELEAGDSWTIS